MTLNICRSRFLTQILTLNIHDFKKVDRLITGVCTLCVYLLRSEYVTHHVVGDGWKHKDGDDAVGDEISKDLGQEVDRGSVISTGVLMTVD